MTVARKDCTRSADDVAVNWQEGTMMRAHTHTHPFNGPLSRTTQVSRYQKGKTDLDFTGARDSEWQWHQLGHMQVCTLLQTDNHASTLLLKFFTGRVPFLPPNQHCQSTEGSYDESTHGIIDRITNKERNCAENYNK